ncbi:MAG TPA: LptA/OstA family protein [Nitrospiria bacterium]|nr:LptA/OstA family protein [Nitrospiria bacterium]
MRIVPTTIGWVLVMWAAVATNAAPSPPGGRTLPSDGTTGASPSTAFRNAPMTITSERLTIHDAEHRASFEGAVVARQGDLTLRADRVDVWTVDSPSATSGMMYGGSNVSLIKAYGHVEVTQGDRVVQADQAVYTQATQQIELTGNLSGQETGGYKVAGTHMVIYLQEHRSVIEQSHVVIPPAALSASPGPKAAPHSP